MDILVLTERKLDETFATSSTLIDVFSSPFWLDRNRKGGAVLTYVRKDIPSQLLPNNSFPNDVERLLVETKFRKRKWLLFGIRLRKMIKIILIALTNL